MYYIVSILIQSQTLVTWQYGLGKLSLPYKNHHMVGHIEWILWAALADLGAPWADPLVVLADPQGASA